MNQLANSIFLNLGSHQKSPVKLENGMQFPATDYALVPRPDKPTTWRLRLAETPGRITVRQLVKAVAELTSGLRGEGLNDSVMTAAKRRIRSEFRRLRVDDRAIPPQVKEAGTDDLDTTGMTIWKGADGVYHWMAIYSNNYLDNDYPAEIITGKSHQEFTQAVNDGVYPLPELWHWHIPGSRWGHATWVDYIDGFAVAGGDVDPGFEQEAEALSKMSDIRVSHGMPRWSVIYDPADSRSIIHHITAEISSLPGWAAANPFTGFTVIKKEADAMLSQAKIDYLKSLGVSEERIAQLGADIQTRKQAADDDGRESKERSENPTEGGKAAEKSDTQASKEGENAADAGAADAPVYLTHTEFVQAMSEVLAPVIEQVGAVVAQVNQMSATVKELGKTDAERLAKEAEVTPQASLSELIASAIVGQDAARLDGRSALAKSGPKEAAKPKPEVAGLPGFLGEIITNSSLQQEG